MRALKTRRRYLRLGAAAVIGAIGALAPENVSAALSRTAAGPVVGTVYTASNAVDGNRIYTFARRADGSLVAGASVATGGNGNGAQGFSQGAVELSPDGRTLVAVNAGSNQVSQFDVRSDGSLRLVGTVASGGTMPVSVAIDGPLVEVLNIGGTANVTGFTLTPAGLIRIPGGNQPLSAGAAGAKDVTISPGRGQVVVTSSGSNTIDTFKVGWGGRLAPAVTTSNTGPGAFASVFTATRQLLVADAGGAGTSAVSGYRLSADGTAVPTGPAVGNGQNAACWITLGANGNVFVANAGSASVSTYHVTGSGTIEFSANYDAGAGSRPFDLVTAGQGRFLYELDGGNDTITGFAIAADGSLSRFSTTAIPSSAAGLAAS